MNCSSPFGEEAKRSVEMGGVSSTERVAWIVEVTSVLEVVKMMSTTTLHRTTVSAEPGWGMVVAVVVAVVDVVDVAVVVVVEVTTLPLHRP